MDGWLDLSLGVVISKNRMNGIGIDKIPIDRIIVTVYIVR